MADDKAEEVVTKPKGNPMILVLIVLVVLLLGAVGFLGYMMWTNMNQEPQMNDMMNKKDMKKELASDESEYFKTVIENLILNITNSKGREKLMKLSFSLKSVEPNISVLVAVSKDEIIDTVIQQISAGSSEELLTVGGKDLLKEELLNGINIIINEANSKDEDILKNNIKQLFFTTFVIK